MSIKKIKNSDNLAYFISCGNKGVLTRISADVENGKIV
jgi:hypothetical protein